MDEEIEQSLHDYARRFVRRLQSPVQEIWDLLDDVVDPEIPVLSLWDLGVLRDVEAQDGVIIITITPTYSGCPALHAMQQDIGNKLEQAGISAFSIRHELSPAWSSDSLSPQGRAALKKYGIAPPECGGEEKGVACPRCQSRDTRLVSEFGATACKALYQCNQCLEPFDYFKCL